MKLGRVKTKDLVDMAAAAAEADTVVATEAIAGKYLGL